MVISGSNASSCNANSSNVSAIVPASACHGCTFWFSLLSCCILACAACASCQKSGDCWAVVMVDIKASADAMSNRCMSAETCVWRSVSTVCSSVPFMFSFYPCFSLANNWRASGTSVSLCIMPSPSIGASKMAWAMA